MEVQLNINLENKATEEQLDLLKNIVAEQEIIFQAIKQKVVDQIESKVLQSFVSSSCKIIAIQEDVIIALPSQFLVDWGQKNIEEIREAFKHTLQTNINIIFILNKPSC